MKKVVLDTDIFIDYLRQPRKLTTFRKLLREGKFKLLLPAVVLTELYIGRSTAKVSGERKLKKILEATEFVFTDEKISKKAGVLIREYPDLYLADALVTATALEKGASLCTFNKSHFEMISDLKLFTWEKL